MSWIEEAAKIDRMQRVIDELRREPAITVAEHCEQSPWMHETFQLASLHASQLTNPELNKEKTMTNRLPGLGDKVREKTNGFEGIVTSHSKHLAGCDRLFVLPKVGADGKFVDGIWCDIDMLDIIEPGAVDAVIYNRSAPGRVDLPPSR